MKGSKMRRMMWSEETRNEYDEEEKADETEGDQRQRDIIVAPEEEVE